MQAATHTQTQTHTHTHTWKCIHTHTHTHTHTVEQSLGELNHDWQWKGRWRDRKKEKDREGRRKKKITNRWREKHYARQTPPYPMPHPTNTLHPYLQTVSPEEGDESVVDASQCRQSPARQAIVKPWLVEVGQGFCVPDHHKWQWNWTTKFATTAAHILLYTHQRKYIRHLNISDEIIILNLES